MDSVAVAWECLTSFILLVLSGELAVLCAYIFPTLWPPIINDVNSYRTTQCRLESMTSMQINCSMHSSAHNLCAQCLVAYVFYFNKDDVSARLAMIYSEANELNISIWSNPLNVRKYEQWFLKIL